MSTTEAQKQTTKQEDFQVPVFPPSLNAGRESLSQTAHRKVSVRKIKMLLLDLYHSDKMHGEKKKGEEKRSIYSVK